MYIIMYIILYILSSSIEICHTHILQHRTSFCCVRLSARCSHANVCFGQRLVSLPASVMHLLYAAHGTQALLAGADVQGKTVCAPWLIDDDLVDAVIA